MTSRGRYWQVSGRIQGKYNAPLGKSKVLNMVYKLMASTRKSLLIILFALCVGQGCPPPAPPVLVEHTIDGNWSLDYSNSPSPTCITITNGRVTSELGGCFEPVAVLSATTAVIAGDGVSFSYQTTQTLTTNGSTNTSVTEQTFNGTFQADESVAGTANVTGTFNGQPFQTVVGFIMRRR